ncbi:MAG: hypothetical protein ACXACK_08025, partial [Candidatus Hodarchaeales archaeon]
MKSRNSILGCILLISIIAMSTEMGNSTVVSFDEFLTQPNRGFKGSGASNTDGNGDPNRALNISKLSCQITLYDTSFIPDVVHTGDLMLNGNEIMVIDNLNYFQQGNIFINNEAKLMINNSQFMLGRGAIPTIHTYIFVSEK